MQEPVAESDQQIPTESTAPIPPAVFTPEAEAILPTFLLSPKKLLSAAAEEKKEKKSRSKAATKTTVKPKTEDAAESAMEGDTEATTEDEKKSKKAWPEIDREKSLAAEMNAYHFTGKLTNTNIQSPPAVRLSAADKIDLPFVSVSTIGVEHIDTDYLSNTSVAEFNQMRTVWRRDVLEKYKSGPPTQEQLDRAVALAPEILEIQRNTPAEVNTHQVDPRFRQIIMPTGDENTPWVSLSPLHSSGLSVLIRNRLEQESIDHGIQEDEDEDEEADEKKAESSNSDDDETQEIKKKIYRLKAFTRVGGGKPVNAGYHATSMHYVLAFTAPEIDEDLRRALAIHHHGHLRGGRFYAPFRETVDFLSWRQDIIKAHNATTMPSNMQIREEEAQHIRNIARAALRSAEWALSQVKAYVKDDMEDENGNKGHFDSPTSKNMSPFMRALIDPNLRDKGFPRKFAQELIRSIERFECQIEDRGQSRKIEKLNDGELSPLVSIAEGVLL